VELELLGSAGRRSVQADVGLGVGRTIDETEVGVSGPPAPEPTLQLGDADEVDQLELDLSWAWADERRARRRLTMAPASSR